MTCQAILAETVTRLNAEPDFFYRTEVALTKIMRLRNTGKADAPAWTIQSVSRGKVVARNETDQERAFTRDERGELRRMRAGFALGCNR
jgi:hypothetical protein